MTEPKYNLGSDRTEVFYHCDPEKADRCRKTTCYYLGRGRCTLTTNPEWSKRPVSSDCPDHLKCKSK